MSIFGKIKDAIFGHKARAQANPATERPNEVTGVSPDFQGKVSNQPLQPQPTAVSEVDVERNLAEMAQGKDLNWRTSIVDLMKLLDMDASLDNRKALATELGYTGEKNGSAEMNTWLHRKVMEELERSGGIVPASMKD
jgi:hypothetical protein